MNSGATGRLGDIEYRREYGAESAKFSTSLALADARETKGVTQAALAELAGTSQAYIAKLERGDANPTIGQLGKIFAAIWFQAQVSWVPLESLDVRDSYEPATSRYEDFMIDEAYKRTALLNGETTDTGTSGTESVQVHDVIRVH